MENLYRIVIDVQGMDPEIMTKCNELYEGADNIGTIFSDFNGEAVIDYLKEWDGCEFSDDDLQEEEPYWVNNGTDYIHEKDGYTLLYNSTIGGVYMLYRKANEVEQEYYKNYIYESDK